MRKERKMETEEGKKEKLRVKSGNERGERKLRERERWRGE